MLLLHYNLFKQESFNLKMLTINKLKIFHFKNRRKI